MWFDCCCWLVFGLWLGCLSLILRVLMWVWFVADVFLDGWLWAVMILAGWVWLVFGLGAAVVGLC